KKHTTYGAEIAGDILGKDADPQMRQMVEEVAHYHHEKWNGTGYPTGKKGEEIPLSARIMAIADVFDALVSKRVYKEAIPVEKAFEILWEEAGQHFDATLVEVFLSEKELIKSMVH
ncbi:MAG: HD-GYP domain-containing protein, partial [Lachnospiraceae bacterium]